MAGVRQFDEDAAFDRAAALFWRRGYEATTMADLAAATGVQRGSLYNAYGGKETLLLKALDRYAAKQGGRALEALTDPDPRRALARLLDAHVARMADPANPTGCLTTNTCLECAERYGAVRDKVAGQFKTAETAIYQALLRGQQAGRLAPHQDVRALARFFLATTRAMAVMHKAYGGDLEVVRDVVRTALRVLDAPANGANEGA